MSIYSFSLGKIIQNSNPNKAHGHDNISKRMIRICGSTIYRPLETIFKDALSTGLFPSEWKKGSIGPSHKKSDKQVLKTAAPFHCSQFVGRFFKD